MPPEEVVDMDGARLRDRGVDTSLERAHCTERDGKGERERKEYRGEPA